jgi:predicted phosphodiesterase
MAFTIKQTTTPEWPVVKQGPKVTIPRNRVKPLESEMQRCIILPDAQIGYFRNRKGKMEPTHDEKAIALALEITRLAKPDMVVLLGDNLDLPELSKYRITPPFQQTTQATIDRATVFCAELRNAAPNAKIVWLAGNHEERLPNHILDNARAAYGLRRGNIPDTWPVLSVPFLCRMEDFDIEYKEGYPANHIWLNQKIRIIHGSKVKSSGSTAHMYLASEKTSVIYGHIHRVELAFKTREDFDGPRTIMAASPGCLARIDGAVPSTKQGMDIDGRPLISHENWQQGMALVEYETTGKNRFTYECIPIFDGTASWRGKWFSV